jgi:hypothetical protein
MQRCGTVTTCTNRTLALEVTATTVAVDVQGVIVAVAAVTRAFRLGSSL